MDPSGTNGTKNDGTDPQDEEGPFKIEEEEVPWWVGFDYFSGYSAANGSAPNRSLYGDATSSHMADGFKTFSTIFEEEWDRKVYTHTIEWAEGKSVGAAPNPNGEITPYEATYIVTWHSLDIYTNPQKDDPMGAISFLTNYLSAAGTAPGYKAALMKELLNQGKRLTSSGGIEKLTTSGAGITNNIARLATISRAITVLSVLPAVYEHFSAFLNGNFNTSNVVDILITGAIIAVGTAASPAIILGAASAGLVYGTVRLVHGKDIDAAINKNFGWGK